MLAREHAGDVEKRRWNSATRSGLLARMFIDRLFTLAANLLPLAGVWWWGWDAFEVLILYWMQTVVVVVFAVLNIRKVPEDGLGTMKIDGVPHRATRRHYIIMFSIIGVMFCAAHLVFLFVFFSGDWTKVVRGPVTFWQTFVIRNGAWLPLLLSVLAALARYLLTPPRSRRAALDGCASRPQGQRRAGREDRWPVHGALHAHLRDAGRDHLRRDAANELRREDRAAADPDRTENAVRTRRHHAVQNAGHHVSAQITSIAALSSASSSLRGRPARERIASVCKVAVARYGERPRIGVARDFAARLRLLDQAAEKFVGAARALGQERAHPHPPPQRSRRCRSNSSRAARLRPSDRDRARSHRSA